MANSVDPSVLTEREKWVLEAIIRHYIIRALPTSSAYICGLKGFDLSAATIRNVMYALEGYGYITQPHRSAGRIPTDKGYRYYIDHLMKPVTLPHRAKEQIHHAVALCGRADLHQLLDAAARVLGRVTRQLCVVVAPRLCRALFRGLYVFPIGERRYLMTITLEAGAVKTTVFELSRQVPDDLMSAACRLLATRLAGRTVVDLGESDPLRHLDVPSHFSEGVRILLPMVRKMIYRENDRAVFTGGEIHVMQQPEFFTKERVDYLRHLCDISDGTLIGLITTPENERGKTVFSIGRELSTAALRHFSIIKTGYNLGSIPGSLGIIGPKRMPYPFLKAAVEYMARALGSVYA